MESSRLMAPRRSRSGLLRRRAGFVGAALLLAMALAACSPGASDLAPQAGNFKAGTSTLIPAHQRKFPVTMEGATWSGQHLDVAAWRGHPLVINIWASWCTNCRQEAPALAQAYQVLKPLGVNFAGIDAQDTSAGSATYLKQYPVAYPSFVSKPAVILALKGAVSPDAIPTTVVLDSQGRIAGRIVGAVSAKALITMVRSVDATNASAAPAAHPSKDAS